MNEQDTNARVRRSDLTTTREALFEKALRDICAVSFAHTPTGTPLDQMGHYIRLGTEMQRIAALALMDGQP